MDLSPWPKSGTLMTSSAPVCPLTDPREGGMAEQAPDHGSQRFGSPTSAEFRAPDPPGGMEGPLQVDTWSTSHERDVYMQRRFFIIGSALGASAVAAVGWALIRPEGRGNDEWWGVALLLVSAVLLLWCLMPYWASRRAYVQRKRATAAARVDQAVRDIATLPDLPLTKLFELNRRQLDEYQEMTKKQQRSAFLLTQIASIFAFLALAAGACCPSATTLHPRSTLLLG